MDTPEVATQTPDWTRRFPEGSLIRRLRVPVGSDVRNTLASQTQSGDSAVQPGTISPAAVAVLNQAQQAQDVDSAVQPGTISPAGIAALNQAQQAQDADSAVQPGTISREDLVAMGEAQQMQGVDSQVQPYGGITSAPAATAATGTPTAATSGIPAAAPAGTTTATGTPTAAAPSSGGITPAGGAPAGGGVGTVGIPVGVPGDPMSFATYRANVQDLAKLDPEEKAVLANMEARTLKRLSRAETQEKGVMNEAFVAAGLAMMGGLNLADGVRRAAESGGKQYFASKAEARKAIDKAEEAQDSFDQYRVALKQGNKKLANEMYGTFYKSYTDYVGKIQAAGISAGASLENAKATREATAEYRAQESRRHDLDRDATMQRHRENINANREQFDIRMQELGNTRDIQRLGVLDKRYEAALEGQRRVRKDMEALLIKEKEAINFSADKPEIKKRKLEALQTDFNAKLAAELRPYKDQAADFLNQQDALISSALSGFKVTNVRPN